jgi:hypothetical protein
MKPTSHRLVWWILLLPLIFVICSWISAFNYDVGISPTGVKDLAGFIHRFGEPRMIHFVERDGQAYYEVIGGAHPRFTFEVPSHSPRYVFDEHGKFIDWCSGLSHTYEFDMRWQRSTNDALPFSDVKQKLGL